MAESHKDCQSEQPEVTFRRLKFSVPAKVTIHTQEGVKEFQGRLEELGGRSARICFDHPVAIGTAFSLHLEFKDKKNREIQFHYKGKVASAIDGRGCKLTVDFEKGVGISGEQSGEILAEL